MSLKMLSVKYDGHFRKGRKELGQAKLNMLYEWLNSNV